VFPYHAGEIEVPAGSRVKPPKFRDLRVRPKLIVLHNVFFLILACAVYYSVIPLVEEYVATSMQQETALLGELFLERRFDLPSAGMAPEDREFGSAEQLGVPDAVRAWLEEHPDETRLDPAHPGFLYRWDAASGQYGRLRFDDSQFERIVFQARISLFAALGVIYLLAVAMLEFVIMPRYVYEPITAHLDADQAVQEGNREEEMIPEEKIPGDEIGDIMRSRNATVRMLREKEANLESAKQGMAAQDRLATIGLLSASVAHELNTPLSVIEGSVEKLIETSGSGPDQERLQRIRKMSHRLLRISEGLLGFSRVHKPETREPVALRALLDEAWTLLAIDERAGKITFENLIEPELTVLGDYDRLMQVFVNLLRNGMLAFDDTGRIVVAASRVQKDGRSWMSIRVDDDGPGIPEDLLPNIFEAFVSTRLDSRGTGLGLTVAEGIVQQHGGQIIASNRPEGGARLDVRLPAA
jgi:signal transduction histidine kinase